MSEELFKKLLFRHFNTLKSIFDKKRADRALGIIQAGKVDEKRKQYRCTANHCECPDSVERGMFCKHRITENILLRIWQDIQTLWLEETYA